VAQVKQFYVVEVINFPTGQLENIFVPVDADPIGVRNGIKVLESEGIRPTGQFTFVERDEETFEIVRTEPNPPMPMFVGGWRTRSAFLR
jgi:hypothetical protein